MNRYRAIWVSDVHLGIRDCKAEFLLDFLQKNPCDTSYLVGDLIDFWQMPRNRRWPDSHSEVLRWILSRAATDCRVVYIPGNHDEIARDCIGLFFGNVEILERTIHTTADGRKLLLVHGDEFDNAVRCNRITEWLGDHGYNLLLALNRLTSRLRRHWNYPYWSLAGALKRRIGHVARYIERFEHAAAHAARKAGCDGIVCGHIHHAAVRRIDGVLYCNDGDWVESCTALAERPDGSLNLIHWSDSNVVPMPAPPRVASAAADEHEVSPQPAVGRAFLAKTGTE